MGALLPQKKRWYAVYTKSKCEKQVHQYLEAFCCAAYLPLKCVKRHWSDRTKKLYIPLIPSYVFIHIRLDERFQVHKCPNVVTILHKQGRILPIPDREIELLKKIELSRLPFSYTGRSFTLAKGDKVVINDGPLMGAEGYIEHFVNTSKVYLQIPSLSGSMVIDASALSPHLSDVKLGPHTAAVSV